MKQKLNLEFYRGKRVLITGHNGFKGTWMTRILVDLGAIVTGYSLESPTDPALFELCGLDKEVESVLGDVRDLELLQKTFDRVKPEIVIHMAAQPIVRESYKDPVGTYSTNVMGTVNVLEAVRHCPSIKSVINVTTDKVYLNKEWAWGYRENEELKGYDPYSNSKSCSELVTYSYKQSFEELPPISTMRAGNVIGGGDFAKDRIVPDCIRAVEAGETIIVRNPNSTRPYQHVLEPVVAYLMVAQKQYEDNSLADSYNVGPDDRDCITTGELVDLFCDTWNKSTDDKAGGKEAKWECKNDNGPHEANFLKLDCTKLKNTFDWKPVWNVEETMEKIVEWSKVYFAAGDIKLCMQKQIKEYLGEY